MDNTGWRRTGHAYFAKTFYPKKFYTPFSALVTPKIFASLFSLPTIPSVCKMKILAVSQFGSLSHVTPSFSYRIEQCFNSSKAVGKMRKCVMRKVKCGMKNAES